MKINLAYGKTGLPVELPAEWNPTIIAPGYVPGIPQPISALSAALRGPVNAEPLRSIVRSGDSVGIIFSDITRPTPHHLIIPAILQELAHVPGDRITLFNATGTHRPNTDAELRKMLGSELVDRYRIVQNDATDRQSQTCLGRSSFGNEIWINTALAECDVKILTGFIEPHFFAGFSGGGKAVMPGMAGLQTILNNHNAHNIGHPSAAWGITRANPIAEEVRQAAALVGRTFLVNVTLNKDKQITGIFAGDLDAAHQMGCEFVKETAMAPVPHAFDIVITTNSGYPLDLNLYQAVKGMSAAAQVVRPGGAIIVAAECWDGIPEHGLYRSLLHQAGSPQELLRQITSPGFLEQDQWQAQIQALIQSKAKVFVYSDHLSDDQVRSALLEPCRRIEDTVFALRAQYGDDATLCVLPEGPQTIPYIQD
jgi:lactate racemase